MSEQKYPKAMPPLIAKPIRKPAMFRSNYGGFEVLGGFVLLGLIGFLIGSFWGPLVGADIEPSLQGGFMGMMIAIWAPFSFVLSFSSFGGIVVLGWVIYQTRRYWYAWLGLILLALASPFLLVLCQSMTESIFAKPDPATLVAEEAAARLKTGEGEDEFSNPEDNDGDGLGNYDEELTGYDPFDPKDTPTKEEADAAPVKTDAAVETGENFIWYPDEERQDSFSKAKQPALLLSYPDPNLRDSRGMTVLHVAAAIGRVGVVGRLLKLGADPSAVDDYGFTALHWAAQNGHLEMVHHLVEEVKVERVADRLSRTPAALAKSRGHAAVSDYLSAN